MIQYHQSFKAKINKPILLWLFTFLLQLSVLLHLFLFSETFKFLLRIVKLQINLFMSYHYISGFVRVHVSFFDAFHFLFRYSVHGLQVKHVKVHL